MSYERLTLGGLDTNCYLIMDDETGQAVVIDPADEGEFISEKISRENLTLEKIILTHAHFDHILAILTLKLNFNAPILMHKKDLFLYKKAASSAKHWLNRKIDPLPIPDQFINGGDQITVGSTTLQVIETPGHTPGSISLYNKNKGILFTGDTLFKNAVGRTDFKYASPLELASSLEQLAKLPPETIILPGHGDESTIGDELGGADGNRTRA